MLHAEQRAFYDEHPFDWVENYDPQELCSVISPLLEQALEAVAPGSLVLDIGCGAGRVMTYMAFRGMKCFGLDISRVSVHIMQNRSGRPGAVVDNLCLPIQDGVADLVVSDGVAHHTSDPYKAFMANCQIVKRGGFFYLGVYKPGGRYEFLYRYPGYVVRRALLYPAIKPVFELTALPLYYFIHSLKSKGKRTWAGARNLFYDYFASPRVTFLPYRTVEQWCRNGDMTLVAYDPNPRGNVHSFLLQKQ